MAGYHFSRNHMKQLIFKLIVFLYSTIILFSNSFGLSKDQGTFALPTFGTSGTNVEINRRGDFSGINFPDKVENR